MAYEAAQRKSEGLRAFAQSLSTAGLAVKSKLHRLVKRFNDLK